MNDDDRHLRVDASAATLKKSLTVSLFEENEEMDKRTNSVESCDGERRSSIEGAVVEVGSKPLRPRTKFDSSEKPNQYLNVPVNADHEVLHKKYEYLSAKYEAFSSANYKPTQPQVQEEPKNESIDYNSFLKDTFNRRSMHQNHVEIEKTDNFLAKCQNFKQEMENQERDFVN